MKRRVLRLAPFLAASLVLLSVVSVTFAAEDGETARRGEPTPELIETQAAAAIPFGIWNAEKLRDVARSVHTLSEPVVSEVMWRVMAAPPDLDTITVFANAIGSDDPAIREVALSFLVGWFTADSRRILMNTLALEQNPETVSLIIGGIARLPRNLAVQGLMDVMFLPGIQGHIVDESAERLRALTEETIPNHPGEWRDWWLDNEERFK